MSAKIKSMLWRLVFAVVVVVILTYMVPLLFELVGVSIPAGPAIALLKFAFACLIIIFVLFGPTTPEPF